MRTSSHALLYYARFPWLDLSLRTCTPADFGLAARIIAEPIVGELGRLSILVSHFKPNVKCFPPLTGKPPPNYRLCPPALNSMSASDNLKVFGEPDTAGVDVALPMRFPERKSSLRDDLGSDCLRNNLENRS